MRGLPQASLSKEISVQSVHIVCVNVPQVCECRYLYCVCTCIVCVHVLCVHVLCVHVLCVYMYCVERATH